MTILNESSLGRPALATVRTGPQRALWLAWTGEDTHLRVLHLDDEDPVTIKLDQTSNWGPALAGIGDTLYIAWTGTNGGQNLNFMPVPVGEAPSGPFSGDGKHTLGESSLGSPALVELGNEPYLAWTERDGTISSMPGFGSEDQKFHTDGESLYGPGLGWRREELWIGWASTAGSRTLPITAVLMFESVFQDNSIRRFTSTHASLDGPAMNANGYAAWSSPDPGHNLKAMTLDDMVSKASPLVSNQSSAFSPAISSTLPGKEGGISVAWTGEDGAHRINYTEAGWPQ